MKSIIGKGNISAGIVADSQHPLSRGRRIITMQLRYPRFIHAEAKTHRIISKNGEEVETLVFTQDDSLMSDPALSRNASSSRAIPVAKMIAQVRTDPAMPIHWGANQPGMQSNAELTGLELTAAKSLWLRSSDAAATYAEQMTAINGHKQWVNRVLEPYQFISVIVTATEWQNFFELRDHPDAQPEIRELARVMLEAIRASTPKMLAFGDWHLPYVTNAGVRKHGLIVARKISAARCARVSYLTHDGLTPSVTKDLELFDRLVGGVPLHASPIEHQATPDPMNDWPGKSHEPLWGNFTHWIQFRKMHEQSVQNKGNT